MARKHFEMNSDVRKLIDKYSENHDVDFSDLINKALKFYLVNQLNYKEVKDALNEVKKHIEEIVPGSVQEIVASPRVSSNGKYISYTIPVQVLNAKNIEDLYQHLGKIDFIKHVL